MKNIILIFSFFTLFETISAQNVYIGMEDATGFALDYRIELEAASNTFVNLLPFDTADNFKVFDAGFYYFHDLTSGVHVQYQKKIDSANSVTPNFLLIAKEVVSENGMTKFLAKLNLPNDGEFTCIGTVQRKEYESFLITKLNDPSFSDPTSKRNNISSVLLLLSEKINADLMCCGSIPPCKITVANAVEYLKSSGFSEYKDYKVSLISNKIYSNIQSSKKIEITINYGDTALEPSFIFKATDDLDIAIANIQNAQSKLTYYNLNNLDSIVFFEPLSSVGKSYSEDIVIIEAYGELKYLYKIGTPLDLPALVSKPNDKIQGVNGTEIFLPLAWLTAIALEKGAMCGVGVVGYVATELGYEMLIEKRESWTTAWDSSDISFGGACFACFEGANSEKKLISSLLIFARNTHFYLSKHDVAYIQSHGWEFLQEAVFKSALETAFTLTIGPYVGDCFKRYSKTLAKPVGKYLKIPTTFFKFKYFAKDMSKFFMKGLAKAIPSPGGFINASKFAENAIKIKLDYGEMKELANQLVGSTTQQASEVREKIAAQFFKNIDAEIFPGKYNIGADNGFDLVAHWDDITYIVEVKPFNSGVALAPFSSSPNMGAQMTDPWIKAVIVKLQNASVASANFIKSQYDGGKIEKLIMTVDEATKELYILKIDY
jgi:hypothetical protein